LREYRRGFETRLEVAESQRLESRLSAIDDDLDDTKAVTNLLTAMRELFATAEEWNARKLGGISFDGTCLDADGIEQKGRFFVVGPATYFCGEGSGIVVRRVGSSRPAIFPNLDAEHAAPISSACTGAASRLPFDLTSGDALKVAARERSLKDHLVSGGFVMVPLALLGTLAAVLALWKLFILGQVRIPSEDTLNGIAEKLRSGQVEDAQALVSEMAAPFHRVLQAGIDHRELRREHLEEILHERAAATVPSLDRHLGMLAVLGGVAPLLGLLGTVTGMIHTFELVTIFGTGDAKLLSGGISEALVTTETGLIIAVPVLLVHAYLVRRVRNVVSALEASIAAFMNQLQVETTSES
jgi:biopolymer transport protein ExbB